MKKDDKNKDLEELMKSATEKVHYENYEKNDNQKKRPTKLIVALSIGAILLGAGIFAGTSLVKKPQEFVDKTETPSWVGKDKNNDETNNEANEFIDSAYPIERYEWTKRAYSKDIWSKEGFMDEVLKASREDYNRFYVLHASINRGGLYNNEKENGRNKYYSNNPEDKLDKDGNPNPLYSYALLEDYEKAYVVYTQRLLDPHFGGWDSIQSSRDYDIIGDKGFDVLKDMFTERWWNENIQPASDYSKLPIMAEWNKGSWNSYNFTEKNIISGLFFGEIAESEERSISSKTLGIDKNRLPIVETNSPIVLKAFDVNDEIIELKGNLKLTLKPNEDFTNEENRVVIDNAELIIEK